MDRDANLRRHLIAPLRWKSAHVDFDTAVKGLSPRLRGVRPDGMPYSIWQLVEHVRLAQRDILDFCRDPEYREPKWPDDYWPVDAAPPDGKAWQRSLASFRADRRELERLFSSRSLDLLERVPNGDGQTWLRECLLVADHNAYHVGEIVAVRRMLGAWP